MNKNKKELLKQIEALELRREVISKEVPAMIGEPTEEFKERCRTYKEAQAKKLAAYDLVIKDLTIQLKLGK